MDRKLLGYKGIKLVLAVVGILTIIQTIAILGMAIFLAEVVSALFAGEPLQEQTQGILSFLAAFGVRYLGHFLTQRVTYRFAETTGTELRKQLMDKLFAHGPRFARTEGTGKLVTLVLDGVMKFRVYLEMFLPRMLGMAITPAVLLVYVFTLDVTSGIILIVTMPILIMFMILIGVASGKYTAKQMSTYRVLANHFVDSLRGLETLKYLGRSKSHIASIGRVSDRYRKATMKTLRIAFLSSFALDFFTSLSVALVAVSLGLRLVNGDMMLVTGLTILILAPEYFLPVRMLGSDFHATQDGKEAGQTIQAIIDAPAAGLENNEVDLDLKWNDKSSITLSDIEVKHTEEGPASLKNVHLELPAQLKIGIIGESGAGKSTLIDVLGGFQTPTAGHIVVNGQQLSTLAHAQWQQQLTYIPQRPYLFSSTLAENVSFYSPDASREAIEQAVQAAGLSELAASLPSGLDEMIGGGGRSLSGGQAQRVALARAFLSDRPIILLDEPTAHLDIETEVELKETMLQLFEGKTVFLATHRLHWMPDMDQIIVMDQGRVAEVGTHQELVERKGVYYKLITAGLGGVL